MRSLSRAVPLALGLVVVTGSGAHALNFCFNPGTLTSKSLAVAERFKRPARGSCSPINGFDLASEATGLQLVTGTACVNSTGDTMRVAYVVHVADQCAGCGTLQPLQVSLILPYPSLLNGHGLVSSPVADETSTNAHANACIPPVIPIP